MILINNRYNTDGGYFSGRSGQSVSSSPIGIKKDDTMDKTKIHYHIEKDDNIYRVIAVKPNSLFGFQVYESTKEKEAKYFLNSIKKNKEVA